MSPPIFYKCTTTTEAQILLYAFTVLFDVYYFTGDPVDALQAGGRTGELVLKRTGRDNGLMAHLYAPDMKTDLMTPLRHASVLAMNSLGMTIEGSITVAERAALKSRANTFTVRWVVKHVGAPAVLNTQKLKERSVRRLAAAATIGFSEADDDEVF